MLVCIWYRLERRFFGKLLDLLDGSWSSVLKPDAVEPLVEVDGVLAGHNLAHGRALALLIALRRHIFFI